MLLPPLISAFAALGIIANAAAEDIAPPPPSPEPIVITELPLPPIAPSNNTGACTLEINPSRTGCLANGVFETFQSGDFLPDGKHVIASVIYQGAPAAPDPASIYTGRQVIIVKTNDTLFPNGDPWKCVTCGVPAENAVDIDTTLFDYPQAFKDGTRLLIGLNVLDCGSNQLTSEECTPEKTFIYPLRWNTGASDGAMREPRLHPDQVHIQFNSYTFSGGSIGQNGYFGRILFNPSPTQGILSAPQYDVVNVTLLVNPNNSAAIYTEGDQLFLNPQAVTIGEARGFTGDGTEITYIGSPVESCNFDIFAAHLTTGAVRRLTSHPEYCDPVSFSPDNKWMAIMDTRGSGRNMFLAGMRGIPPLVDMIVSAFPASTRNNRLRRFFEPYLLDFYGDRESYFGQKINGDNNGIPGRGGINDPEWNGMADPRWSPDSTQLVFWQTHTISPSCGGDNPLPCYNSTEPGGRNYRMHLATFTSRYPSNPSLVTEHSDIIPWGVPYGPDNAPPTSSRIPAGVYTLTGKKSGSAEVNITWLTAPQVGNVSVVYTNYSDDGLSFLDGSESVTVTQVSVTASTYDWYSDITQSGAVTGTKRTNQDGYHARMDVQINLLTSTGSLITTLDGVEWKNPISGYAKSPGNIPSLVATYTEFVAMLMTAASSFPVSQSDYISHSGVTPNYFVAIAGEGVNDTFTSKKEAKLLMTAVSSDIGPLSLNQHYSP
ncbi:saponin hydrolase precursor [Bisporella sp. PMI_857]|nr:saponin hydrolase precursor [Bisporella sp. PMI_857]